MNDSTKLWRPRALAKAVAMALLVTGSGLALAEDGVSDSGIFRRNVSHAPELLSNKAKIGSANSAYVNAESADGIVLVDPIPDENNELSCAIGFLTAEDKCQVQPMVVSYVEGHAGQQDAYAAVSLDDGSTWKRTNLSHSADKPVVIDDVVYGLGTAAKPALAVAGKRILVAWTSTLCQGGVPDGGDGNQALLTGVGDPSDLYQVNGKQGIVDYAELDRPDLGVAPFSCLWAARGVIDTTNGEVVWRAPERLTSGRRDAYQLSVSSSKDGFTLVWQEDPEGLQPGSADGPGDGMSGATVSKKTDIWYSNIAGGKFEATCPIDVCPINGDPSGTGDGKPKVLNPMSDPVPISDNAPCKVVLEVAEDGTETEVVNGAPICEQMCATYGMTAPDEDGDRNCLKNGVALDGDTGASRPNIFMDGSLVSIGYEETKGMGGGPNEDPQPEDADDIGKNVIYHHFASFTSPPRLDPGTILNLPELDDNGKVLTTEDGELLYENARRVRFIKQSLADAGASASNTALVAIWKQGPEGKGRQADIMLRRAVGGYAPSDFACEETWKQDPSVCIAGAQNMSSPDYGQLEKDTDGVTYKVLDWKYKEHNLSDPSTANPYDDARAHRGILRGDFLVLGYTWTPNWAAARNGKDLYDFYVRRSFDGGQTWTDFEGLFEEPRNLSRLRDFPGQGLTAIEPRLVGTPGTFTGKQNPDDAQNDMVFVVSYGTSTNPDTNIGDLNDDDEVSAEPQDLFWSWTDNLGETYKYVYNENNGRYEFDWLAQNHGVHEGEAQVRVNPAGTKVFASWLAETDPTCEGDTCGPCAPGGPRGSDICFRKIEGLSPLGRYDANQDGEVDEIDAALFDQGLVTNEASYDYNEDTKVDKKVDQELLEAAMEQWQHREDVSGN